MIKRKIVDGTAYLADTSDQVVQALEWARLTGTRIRIWCGDTNTGKAWAEENDVLGYVGRSSGARKIPILVHNRQSFGGGAILTHCIVRIDTTDGRTLYKHPSFSAGDWTVQGTDAYRDGQMHARFDAHEKATRYVAFMTGKRYSK